jgi:glycosyltransferase involved in cell wall biosynthesis
MSDHSPAVSWLLCTHVADDALRRAITSCLDQTFTDFELLLIANGPQNAQVAATVASWFGEEPRLRVLSTDVRYLIFSLNLGLHHARGELVARMDSDDLAYRERLARQFEFMQTHSQVAVLGSAYNLIDTAGRVLRRVEPPLADRDIRRALLRGNPLCHPSVMLRRRVVLDAGGYLGGLDGEDYDLWSRLALDRSLQFANLAEPLIGYSATPIGNARRARSAYAARAAAQWRNFVAGAGLAWAGAALWTMAKAAVRSAPKR